MLAFGERRAVAGWAAGVTHLIALLLRSHRLHGPLQQHPCFLVNVQCLCHRARCDNQKLAGPD